MVIRVTDAILAINPNASVRVLGDDLDRIEWYDETPVISKSDIQAKMTELQADYDAKDYARKRKAEYPSIEECVHAILDDTLDELQILRQAVKDKHPKGGL
mgnify:CR=1 FL=1